MWYIATILGILGVFLLFIILLAIPIDLIFHFEKDVDFRSRVRVEWMFGLIGKDIRRKKKEPEKKDKKRKRIIKSFSAIFKTRGFFQKRSVKSFLAVIRTKGFLWKVIKLIRGIIRLPKVRNLKLDLRIGLNDPADTGLLFALVGPAMIYLRSCSSLDVWVEPDFERESVQGYFKGELRIFPIKFIKHFALFIFSITTIRVIKNIVMAIRK